MFNAWAQCYPWFNSYFPLFYAYVLSYTPFLCKLYFNYCTPAVKDVNLTNRPIEVLISTTIGQTY